MVELQIREQPIEALAEQALVSIAFRVERVLDVVSAEAGLGGLRLRERALEAPFEKDYDLIPGAAPGAWAGRFDVSRWGLLGAYQGELRVGGAVVAFDAPELEPFAGAREPAVLWDLRVAPERRGRGVGSALIAAAERWAAARGCSTLVVETQNVNLPACRLYARSGFTLGAIRRFAYPALPEEVQLLWYKPVSR